MGYTYQDIAITDLYLDEKNPRFASSSLSSGTQVTQERIFKHLIKYANIDELAKRIRQVGHLHPAENIVCCVENNKYVVLEGNRRICACKLLLDSRLVPQGEAINFSPLDIAKADEQSLISKLSTVKVVLYDSRSEVQDYLSDRHITGIKMWDSLEKDRYYYNLFMPRKSINDVLKNTSDKKGKVEERIKKYTLFLDVFNALKVKYPNLIVEDLPSYLPLVDRFIITLFEDYSDGLAIYANAQLKYVPKVGKEIIYNEILTLVGEAFLIKTTGRIISGDPRIKSKTTRISAINSDTLVPGLKALIQQYKATTTSVSQVSATNISSPQMPAGGQVGVISSTVPPTPVPSAIATPPSTFTPPSQLRQKLDFSQSEYNNLNLSGGNDGEKKAIQIIRELSLLDVDKYPFACAVLYRTLLEAAANIFINRSNINSTNVGSALFEKLKAINDHVFRQDANKKGMIRSCLNGQTFTKMLNHYIHDLTMVDVGTVLQTWQSMKELIKGCLS